MTYRNKRLERAIQKACAGALLLVLFHLPGFAVALESDRQQPLEVSADDTDGTLGDGVTVLSGRVEIRQGTLNIEASRAEVEKADGKVRLIRLLGQPARLEQEIEEQGLVQAEAATITYEVGAGLVRLTGAADVNHPQYRISGESLTYDLDRQHFEGTSDGASGETTDGRIRIRLEPEVAADLQARGEASANDAGDAATDDSDQPDGDDSDDDLNDNR